MLFNILALLVITAPAEAKQHKMKGDKFKKAMHMMDRNKHDDKEKKIKHAFHHVEMYLDSAMKELDGMSKSKGLHKAADRFSRRAKGLERSMAETSNELNYMALDRKLKA